MDSIRRDTHEFLSVWLLLLLVSLTVKCVTTQQFITWQRVDSNCLENNDDDVISATSASDSLACAHFGNGVSGDLVAQWHRLALTCRLFHFRTVCRQLISNGAGDCVTFRRNSPPPISERLVGVWVADTHRRLDNLVCQRHRDFNRFHATEGVVWTPGGAEFDGGAGTFAVLNDSDAFGDLTVGHTWLMRLRRQPKVQLFMEAVKCTDLTTLGSHLWELPSATQLYFQAWSASLPNVQFNSAAGLLPSSATDWIDVGYVGDVNSSTGYLYFNGSFVASATSNAAVTPYSPTCFRLGNRYGDGRTFQGVIRLIGIANASMSLQEIRQFFDSFPDK